MKSVLVFTEIPAGEPESECVYCSGEASHEVRTFPGSYIEPEEWVDVCESCLMKMGGLHHD